MTIGTNDKPAVRTLVFILLLLLVLIAAVLFNSCTVTNKNKSVHKSSVDSTSVVKIDSSAKKSIDSTNVKKNNVVTVKESEDNYTKETVYEFVPLGKLGDSVVYGYDAPVKKSDYFPAQLAKITIKETGIKKAKEVKTDNSTDSSRLVKIDTSSSSHASTTDLHKTDYTKDKVVKHTSYWGWLWLLLIIPAYLCYRNWPKIKTFLKIV